MLQMMEKTLEHRASYVCRSMKAAVTNRCVMYAPYLVTGRKKKNKVSPFDGLYGSTGVSTHSPPWIQLDLPATIYIYIGRHYSNYAFVAAIAFTVPRRRPPSCPSLDATAAVHSSKESVNCSNRIALEGAADRVSPSTRLYGNEITSLYI